MGLILPSVQKVQPQTQVVHWQRARLYPKQEAAIFDRRRISVIEASSKSGKTEGCIVWLMEMAMSGRLGVNYWWVAPVSAQAAIAFSRMRDKVAESPITFSNPIDVRPLLLRTIRRVSHHERPGMPETNRRGRPPRQRFAARVEL